MLFLILADNLFILPNEILFAEVEDCLGRGESITIPFSGTSMGWLLHTNKDKITLSPIVCPLQVNDVVLFRYKDRHILHRIIQMDSEHIVTQGDACVSKEFICSRDVVGILSHVRRKNGRIVLCNSFEWRFLSIFSLVQKKIHNSVVPKFNVTVRRRLSVVYFICLLLLMWLPLGNVSLDNFVFGIRLDHIMHASVYLPCTVFLMDSPKLKSWRIWLVAILISLLTESVQYLLPYRGFDINDLMANFLGVTLGWLVVWPHRRIRR